MDCTCVGFIVSGAVGDAVTRHRVTRQLRHLMRDRYRGIPYGTGVVVRALPTAGGRTSAELGIALDRALGRALQRAGRPSAAAAGGSGPLPAVSS